MKDNIMKCKKKNEKCKMTVFKKSEKFPKTEKMRKNAKNIKK